MDSGILIDDNFEDPEKQESPRDVTEPSIVIDDNDLHPEKQ
jgi:hypothetical protein